MFEMVENEGLLNERYDHFNQKATWKAGTMNPEIIPQTI